MKKIILTIVLAAITVLNYAQVSTTTNPTVNKADLLLKSKKQKTAAWVCLGGGSILAATGIILAIPKVTSDVFSVAVLDPQESNYAAETIMVVVGGASMLASIPLFISSSNNRHRAKLMVTSQKTATGLLTAIPKTVTGLTVSISL